MNKMSRNQYRAYLKTPKWKAIRARAIERAGNQCEFVANEDDPNRAGRRCQEKTALQVHHKTYENVGDERNEDLAVLCRLHHVVEELLEKKCLRCDDSVFDSRDDAEEFVRSEDDYERRVVASDFLEELLDSAPSVCGYCDHMSNKDD